MKRTGLVALSALLLVAFTVVLVANRFRYDRAQLHQGSGEFLIRTNRLTGSSEVFTRWGWVTPAPPPTPTPRKYDYLLTPDTPGGP